MIILDKVLEKLSKKSLTELKQLYSREGLGRVTPVEYYSYRKLLFMADDLNELEELREIKIKYDKIQEAKRILKDEL